VTLHQIYCGYLEM